MAHTTITPTDEDRYYEGNYIAIRVQINDEFDDEPVDLTGYSATFDVKEDPTDVEPLLTRSGEEGGTDDEIEFTDPTSGELTVHIASQQPPEEGGTDGILDSGEVGDIRQSDAEFVCFLDVTDELDRLVTVEEFYWTIHAR